MEASKPQIDNALNAKNWPALLRLARAAPNAVIHHLTGRLYASDDGARWKAVRGLGVLARDPDLFGDHKLRELLRRFFWWLNDESGAVPFGVAEAIGEILAARPGLQQEFLSMLCSLAYHQDMVQTGPIERGVYWALGRVGPPTGACSPEAVEAIVRAAAEHPDPQTRAVAQWALARIAT